MWSASESPAPDFLLSWHPWLRKQLLLFNSLRIFQVHFHTKNTQLKIGFPNYSRLVRKPRPSSFVADSGTIQRQLAKRASLYDSWKPTSFPGRSVKHKIQTNAVNLSQVGSIVTSPTVQMGAQSEDILVKPVEEPLPAQYSYDSFDQVLEWIAHFSNILGHHTPQIFDGLLKLRDYYLSEGNAGRVKSMENTLKITLVYAVLKRIPKTSVKNLLENRQASTKENLSVG